MPKHGPSEGSRKATIADLPILLRPRAKPIETVVLPIPDFVAVIAVTKINLPFLLDLPGLVTLAMYLP